MKYGVLCLLLVSGCWFLDPEPREPARFEYVLTWTCLSPEGCERTQDVARIDHMENSDGICRLTSTQDESFSATGRFFSSDALPADCAWLDLLSLFGHALEQARWCDVPGGFEMEIAIPDQDPATSSLWLVEGRLEDLL